MNVGDDWPTDRACVWMRASLSSDIKYALHALMPKNQIIATKTWTGL